MADGRNDQGILQVRGHRGPFHWKFRCNFNRDIFLCDK